MRWQRSPDDTGSPGSHGRNWSPAETLEDYLRNCEEGLETRSERRVAKLMGVSRAELWRWKMMAELPEDLFEALLGTSAKKMPEQPRARQYRAGAAW
jgi:hypothetical protein